MSSRVAGVVGLIRILPVFVGMDGISPPPLPARVDVSGRGYITVREIMARDLQSLTGKSNLTEALIQVEIWHKDYEVAQDAREQLKLNYSAGGMMGFKGPTNGVIIKAPIRHNVDAELYDGNRELHQVIARFDIWFEV